MAINILHFRDLSTGQIADSDPIWIVIRWEDSLRLAVKGQGEAGKDLFGISREVF